MKFHQIFGLSFLYYQENVLNIYIRSLEDLQWIILFIVKFHSFI